MTEKEREHLVAEYLEDYHRRRALGQAPRAEEYRERLGEHYEAFCEVLAAESVLDELLEPALLREALPETFGEYTLLRELGRGAMGVVYEAIHRGLGRKVAIKILRTGFDTEPVALERFRREAQACAQVRHDHIIEIYESGQVKGRPYYAMPLLEGRTLSECIKSGRVPDPVELCSGLANIADALDALHRAGIVHRDVKPSNILIDPSGKWVLCDFGLARTAETQALTQTGEALGTPFYMSPEQILGKREEIDGRTDVYGLGVTMYEALAGRPPFRSREVAALLRMILNERPEPLSKVAPQVPRDCASVAMKSLEKRKEDRYPSAAALGEDLRAFVQGQTVAGRPVSEVRHALRRMRRYAVAASVLVALGAGALLWYLNRPATLSLNTYPVARVVIDGQDKGTTPLRVSLAPGSHNVTLRLEGFGERRHTIVLEAGEKRSFETALIASDPDDPEALARLGLALDRALDGFRNGAVPVVRSVRLTGPVEVLFPRGDVRLEDLTTYRIDVTDDLFEPNGTLEFRRGDEVLYRAPFDPERTVTEAVVPGEVMRALKPGDEVAWGYFPKEGPAPVVGSFAVVVGQELDHVMAKLEGRLQEQPERVKSWFKLQLYLEEGLDLAAFQEARRILRDRPRDVRAWKAVNVALTRMKLVNTNVWTEVQQQLHLLEAD